MTRWLHVLKNHISNGCPVSVVSFEQEAKSKQEKNVQIKKLSAEIGNIIRLHRDTVV